jgi:hypothetical protein
MVAALAPALLEKVAQIETLATEQGVTLASLPAVKSALTAGDLKAAKRAMVAVDAAPPAVAAWVEELRQLLE